MTTDIENLGWLEYHLAVPWAELCAACYWLRHPIRYRTAYECIWVEDRNNRNRYGEPLWDQRYTWIGVTEKNAAGKWVAVKTFFGKPRFLY